MKWSIQQLQKLTSSPLIFDEIVDFTELAENVTDIIKINYVKVNGVITNVNSSTYHVVYHVEAALVLQCALTLEPVDYVLSKDYDEMFSTVESNDVFLIEKNTLDLDLAVWSNILVDKPLVVTRDDAYDILKARGIILNETFDEKE